jgi:hypothetical protein
MKKYSHSEVVVGSIHDDETYGEIDRFIHVLCTIKELQSAHLNSIMEEFSPEHKRVSELKTMVYRDYDFRVLNDEEVARAVHLAVSLVEVVDRHRLDDLAVL